MPLTYDHPGLSGGLVPSLDLGFTNQKYRWGLKPRGFSDIITFTRASGGGRFNAAGQYEWLPNDVPRIDYDPVTGECKGLLIEEQRTNLHKNSADFTSADWSKTRVSVTSGPQPAPDGSAAQFVSPTTELGPHFFVASEGNSAFLAKGQSEKYSGSVHFKEGGHRYLSVSVIYDSSRSVTATVDTITGIVTYSGDGSNQNFNLAGLPKVTKLHGGWHRLTVTADVFADIELSRIRLFIMFSTVENLTNPAGSPSSFAGDGVSGVYIWGAQLEAGSFPTSYIPTTTAQVTRAADVANVNVLSPWYRADEGTLFADVAGAVGGGPVWAGAAAIYKKTDSPQYSNHAMIRSVGTAAAYVGANGNSTNISGTGVNTGIYKGALALKAADYAFAANSGAVITIGAPSAMPIGVDSLAIGRAAGSSGYLNGHIRSIRYWPKRLSDAELQALTA